jgi:predicted ATPase/DNA-binding SARP family transcriptional activator
MPPMNRTASFDLGILGPVVGKRRGVPVALGPPKQRALLARLVISANQVVSRDVLIEDLWAGEPPAGAAKTLRSYISRLRSALGDEDDAPAIQTRPPGYVLELRPDQLDVSRFERFAVEGRDALARGSAGLAADRLREALSLWRGPALDDVADAPFARAEAARLDELRLAALEDRIEADLVLGRHSDVVAELDRLVEEHPLRERLWRQLIIALYRCERQVEALSAYRRVRELLAGELGLEPSASLRELEQAILRHELAPARGPETPHNIPAQLTSFVGRERELGRLERLLSESRLVTLTGIGGVGKTRLALEAALRVASGYRDGVWLVELAGLADSALVPQEVAATVRIEKGPDRPAAEELREYLRSRQLLLLLDNCEHLVGPCADLVSDLLRACPELRVLATSREPLGTHGERCEVVSPLPLPAAGASGADVVTCASVRLLLDRAIAVRPELEATPMALTAAATIARELEGLPLAIELAAGRARALTLDEIASRLDDRLRLLRSPDRAPVVRHQTLTATMDWSYDLLTEDEREVLRSLSVFAGRFTLDAVAQICRDGDAETALDVIDRLVATSLVVAEDAGGAMRYRLLETVRRYAADRLEQGAEGEHVRRRHAHYYLELAERLREHEPLGHRDRLDAEHDNFRAALSWARETGESEVELRLATAFAPYWGFGHVDEARRWLEHALASRASLPLERAKAHAEVGYILVRLGEYAQAGKLLTHALVEFRVLGHTAGIGHVLLALSTLAAIEGDAGRASRLAEEAARWAHDHQDENLTMWAAIDLARLALGRGDRAKARTLLHDALAAEHRKDALAEEHRSGTLSGGFLSLMELAFLALHEDNHTQALSLFQESIALQQRLSIFALLPECLSGVAIVAAARAQDERAARLLAAADSLRELVGRPSRPQPTTWQHDRTHQTLASIRGRLGDGRFTAAWALGKAMTPQQAIAYAADARENNSRHDDSVSPQHASPVDA